jgi:hypothetical protein
MDAAKGSIRRRGSGSCELLVSGETDPVPGKRHLDSAATPSDSGDSVIHLHGSGPQRGWRTFVAFSFEVLAILASVCFHDFSTRALRRCT